MFWAKFAILSLGLLLCATSVTAGEIDRSTDTQGTIHIGNPKQEKSSNSTDTAIDPDIAGDGKKIREQSDRLDEKGRPRSRRPMNPYARPMLIPGSPYPPTEVRPRPLPGADNAPPIPGVGQNQTRPSDADLRYTPPPPRPPGAKVSPTQAPKVPVAKPEQPPVSESE